MGSVLKNYEWTTLVLGIKWVMGRISSGRMSTGIFVHGKNVFGNIVLGIFVLGIKIHGKNFFGNNVHGYLSTWVSMSWVYLSQYPLEAIQGSAEVCPEADELLVLTVVKVAPHRLVPDALGLDQRHGHQPGKTQYFGSHVLHEIYYLQNGEKLAKNKLILEK